VEIFVVRNSRGEQTVHYGINFSGQSRVTCMHKERC